MPKTGSEVVDLFDDADDHEYSVRPGRAGLAGGTPPQKPWLMQLQSGTVFICGTPKGCYFDKYQVKEHYPPFITCLIDKDYDEVWVNSLIFSNSFDKIKELYIEPLPDEKEAFVREYNALKEEVDLDGEM
jgi:hypothetical protein